MLIKNELTAMSLEREKLAETYDVNQDIEFKTVKNINDVGNQKAEVQAIKQFHMEE